MNIFKLSAFLALLLAFTAPCFASQLGGEILTPTSERVSLSGISPSTSSTFDTLSVDTEPLSLEHNRPMALAAIQNILLKSLSIARSHLNYLKGISRSMAEDEVSEFYSNLWNSYKDLYFTDLQKRDRSTQAKFSQFKIREEFLHKSILNNEVFVYQWTFLSNQLTELLLKSENLTATNSTDWFRILSEVAGDSIFLYEDSFNHSWEVAKPYRCESEKEQATIFESRDTHQKWGNTELQEVPCGVDRENFFATQFRNHFRAPESDETLILGKQGTDALKILELKNSIHNYYTRQHIEWEIIQGFLERLLKHFDLEPGNGQHSIELSRNSNQLQETSLSIYKLESEPLRKPRSKKLHAFAISKRKEQREEIRKILVKLTIPQIPFLKVTQVQASAPTEQQSSGKQKNVTKSKNKNRRKKKKNHFGKAALDSAAQAITNAIKPSHPPKLTATPEPTLEVLSAPASEVAPAEALQEFSRTEEAEETTSESDLKLATDSSEGSELSRGNGGHVAMKDSRLYKPLLNKFQNDTQAMKRKLALDALKAEQQSVNHPKKAIQIFERISLPPKDFDIYHRIMNRGGETAPSWNEFTRLMRHIFKITGGKMTTNGNGAAHTFRVGLRKFNVHKPRQETQSIPEDYLRNFIQPGFEFVGLNRETVVPE